jgi:hypothetical protein
MAVIVETLAAEDLEYGVGETEKTHPGGGAMNGHQISLSSFSTVGPKGVAATKTWAPDEIPIGSQVVTTIEVPGAEPIDMVLASFTGFSTSSVKNVFLLARVQETNTVLVAIINHTNEAVSPASGTLSVLVFKHR